MQLLLGLASAPFVIWLVVVLVREPLRLALPVYAALIPFGGAIALGDSKFTSLSSLAGIVLGAGLVLRLLRRGQTGVRLSATVPIWLLLLAFAGATVIWSLDPGMTVSSVYILVSLIAIYVLIALCPVDRSTLRRVENGLLVGGLACVGYGLFQLIVLGGFPSDPPVPGSTDGRFGNDLLGPNNQAVALILPLLVSTTRSVTLPDRSKRLLYVLASGLLLGGILMTGSRGGMLATGVAILALVAFVNRGKATLATYGLVAMLVAAFVFFTNPFGLAERSVETTSSSGRTDIWQVGLAACPEYCAFGSGWGTFPAVYADTQASVPGASVLVGGGAYEPHNVWILVGIELGVLGVALLAAGLLATFSEALRLPAALRGAPLAGLAATVFAATFLSNLEFKFFWMALILVALSRNLTDLDEPVAAADSGPSVATFPDGRIPRGSGNG
jgi:O-antigen ligase